MVMRDNGHFRPIKGELAVSVVEYDYFREFGSEIEYLEFLDDSWFTH